jgi:hypothetical protein
MIKLLLNPLAKGAYFTSLYEVAEAELSALFPELSATRSSCGPLRFLDVELAVEEAAPLMRLSCAQALFMLGGEGALIPLELDGGFSLPEELVTGSKYRGKTHELVTQLALNVALAYGAGSAAKKRPALLDPMAGRGTTLLWAARYGLEAHGIELEREALDHFQRDVKRQTKLHKVKHKEQSGVIGHKKSPLGRFFELTWAETDTRTRLISGDSAQAEALTSGKRFQYIVSDLPYGVQFTDRGGKRGPLESLKRCAPAWRERLAPGGVMVLIFNALQPKRAELIELFEGVGMELIPFEAPHRMSESILRDLVVFKRPS